MIVSLESNRWAITSDNFDVRIGMLNQIWNDWWSVAKPKTTSLWWYQTMRKKLKNRVNSQDCTSVYEKHYLTEMTYNSSNMIQTISLVQHKPDGNILLLEKTASGRDCVQSEPFYGSEVEMKQKFIENRKINRKSNTYITSRVDIHLIFFTDMFIKRIYD